MLTKCTKLLFRGNSLANTDLLYQGNDDGGGGGGGGGWGLAGFVKPFQLPNTEGLFRNATKEETMLSRCVVMLLL